MPLFLGNSTKLKIATPNGTCRLYVPTPPSSAPTISGVMLKSFDGYILKDSTGIYLTAKEVK